MAGDNRTPEKTIGEVKYAQRKHDEERRHEGHDTGKSDAKAARNDSEQQPPKGGDNRTPDVTIGEVKYAQARRNSKSRSN